MPSQVAAALQSHWGDPEALSRAQRRHYDFERKLRLSLNGAEPNPMVIAQIRSGEWERRQRWNMQNLLRNRARLAGLKRHGYSFDAEHRLVAPLAHVPERRESAPQPQRRSSARRRATGRDPDEPAPGRAGPPELDPYERAA